MRHGRQGRASWPFPLISVQTLLEYSVLSHSEATAETLSLTLQWFDLAQNLRKAVQTAWTERVSSTLAARAPLPPAILCLTKESPSSVGNHAATQNVRLSVDLSTALVSRLLHVYCAGGAEHDEMPKSDPVTDRASPDTLSRTQALHNSPAFMTWLLRVCQRRLSQVNLFLREDQMMCPDTLCCSSHTEPVPARPAASRLCVRV